MYQGRLRSTTGCLRCRKSKKKCDEKRPVCSFCQRRGLVCTWPDQDGTSVRTHQQPFIETPTDVFRKQKPSSTSVAARVLAFDPFHQLPIPEHLPCREITILLHKFFTDSISSSLPFDISIARQRLARGWAHSMFADTAVCYSLIAYSIQKESEKVDKPSLKITSLEYETRGLEILQTRLYAPEPLSEGTLVVAALNFTMFAFSIRTPEEIRKVWKGVGLMVDSHGGYQQIARRMHNSTLAAIANCDTLASFLIAEQPLLKFFRPLRPDHMDNLYTDTLDYTHLIDKIGLPGVDLLRDVRFVLFFREPSKQTRALSIDESEYLFRLLGFIDNRLGWLQAQHIGSGTLMEVLVSAMVVLKIEVIAEFSQHYYLVEAVLRRLQQALVHTFRGDSLSRLISLWACVVALTGSAPISWRDMFLEQAKAILLEMNGTGGWTRQKLQEMLSGIAWHDRLHRPLNKLLIDMMQSDELASFLSAELSNI